MSKGVPKVKGVISMGPKGVFRNPKVASVPIAQTFELNCAKLSPGKQRSLSQALELLCMFVGVSS